MKVILSTLVLAVALAIPAEAQLKLQISDGRVTLDAVNVPTRQILAEWARIGGTRIVGGDKVAGAPLTLKLVDVPEKQALDIILRNVAGFMAAPRLASAAPGASAYDRILIMATSSAPAAPTNANTRAGATQPPGYGNMPGRQRVPPRPPNLPAAGGEEPPVADDQVEDDQADTGMEQPVFTFPSPGQQPGVNGQPGMGAPVFMPVPNNGQPAPVITLQPGNNGPTVYTFPQPDGQPGNQPVTPPSPTGTPTYGVGSPQPGMIQMPPPTTRPPTARPPTTRPPGGG
jgi:hypothetical protein